MLILPIIERSFSLLKSKVVLSVFILFLLGGCNVLGQKDISEMDPAELPDVIAFQDDFTREFMSSLDEVEDGYYLFESRTDGYTMMYPENAKMDQLYYQMPGEHYEAIQFADEDYYVRSTYNAGTSANDPNSLQVVLSSHVGYEGEYEKIECENKTIYFATTEYHTQDGESATYRFFGVIMSNHSEQSVSMRYNIINDNDSNEIDLNHVQDEAMKIIESIEFK